MNLSKSYHCIHCIHHKKDVMNGIKCKLTKRKPQFTNVCVNFSPKDIELIIIDINYDVAFLLKKRLFLVINFLFFLVVAILASYLYYYFTKEKIAPLFAGRIIYLRYYLPFFVLASLIPIKLFAKGTAPIFQYYRDYQIALPKKKKYEALLKKYNIRYTFDFELVEDKEDSNNSSLIMETKEFEVYK